MQDGQKILKFPDVILFDWDDCLVTQDGLIAEITDITLKNFLSAQEYESHKSEEIISGQSMKRVFPRIFGASRWETVKAAYYEQFEIHHLDRLSYMPGALEILKYCKEHLQFLGIVSNKKGQFLRKEIEYLDKSLFFDAMIGSEDAKEDKPSRAPVDLALAKYSPFAAIIEQQKPYKDNLWFIGDRPTDLLTAQAAGCIGVYVGPLQFDALEPKPDLCFRSLNELHLYLASSQLLNQYSDEHFKAVKTFGDMSPRQYTRCEKLSTHSTCMLMDAHLQPQSLKPFLSIQGHLKQLGYSVPEVYAQDLHHSLLLIEDFGDTAFQDILNNKPLETEQDIQLYELAVDLLIDLHKKPVEISAPASIPDYDPSIFMGKLKSYLVNYRAFSHQAPLSQSAQTDFVKLWEQLIQQALDVPKTLVLRDYNRRNIFFLNNREGLNKCGLIDFQDAARGPITEDLVSLLTSSRIPMDPSLKHRLIMRYLAAFPELDLESFWNSWHILTTHRILRILGLYTQNDLNQASLKVTRFIPRLNKLLNKTLNKETAPNTTEWSALKHWLETHHMIA